MVVQLVGEALLLMGTEARQLLLQLLAFGNVPHGGGDQRAFGRLHRAVADFYGEFRPILAPAQQIGFTRPHRSGLGHLEKTVALGEITGLQRARHQDLHRLAHQFHPGPTEHLLGQTVDHFDSPRLIHHHQRVRRKLKQVLKLPPGSLQFHRAFGDPPLETDRMLLQGFQTLALRAVFLLLRLRQFAGAGFQVLIQRQNPLLVGALLLR